PFKFGAAAQVAAAHLEKMPERLTAVRADIPRAVDGFVLSVDAQSYSSAATGFRNIPMPLISTSAMSPGFIHTGGFLLDPTPPGVPVEITSPGTSSLKVVR